MTNTATKLLCLLLLGPALVQAEQNPAVLDFLGKLESARDPKCHATATRLESLIYGTPLTEDARYLKTEMQKHLARKIWQSAASETADTVLSEQAVLKASNALFTVSKDDKSWRVRTSKKNVDILERDREHYGSIAYSLRALLAIEQENLLDFSQPLPELEQQAIEELKSLLDLVTLALIKEADSLARSEDNYQITPEVLTASWYTLFPEIALAANQPRSMEKSAGMSGLLAKIIEQKIASFDAYNQVSQPLFARNLQVYFAKMALPADEAQKAAFKQYFTEAMVAFSASLYLTAQADAAAQGVIRESHVESAMQRMLPHRVNEYEDVVFFPNYPSDKRRVIESYDMDAFRDGGLHWLYFKEALSDLGERVSIEADPFAAELISETIAHYGVLLLREAGEFGTKAGDDALSSSLVAKAYQNIDAEVASYLAYKAPVEAEAAIVSADDSGQAAYFTEVSAKWQVNAQHRTSDWLSRQLRSYLKKDSVTGISTIPPAFGGAGVAAEDINGDGLIDILLLSGLGNRLYLNKGDHFIDVTEKSGLESISRRAVTEGQSTRYAEPRQPLIADWDNDGDQDIFISYVGEPHRIYANDGKGHFTEMTLKSGLGGSDAVGGPATTFDVNNDGLLDIYIEYFGNYLKGDLPTLKRRNDNGGVNQLFINKGNFVFEKAPNALGADNKGWGQAVTHTDLNQDGWQDLIVGNDFGVNAYYINRKGEQFVDYAAKLGTDKPSYTMNIGLTDLNQDGIADVYISNIVTMNKDQKYVLPNEDMTAEFNPDKLGNMRVIEGNDLFMSSLSQQKAISYSLSDKVGRGYSSTGWAWDADFFDADNDGDEDLYVLNGMNDYFVYSRHNPYYANPHTGESMAAVFPDAAKASNVFFLNSNGSLQNASAASGLDFVANSRSAAYLDMDNDGDLDVMVNNFHDKARLYQNGAEALKNNWIKIQLVGAPHEGVNRDAIGAQVILGIGKEGYAWRQVSGSQGYMSVHPKTQHIGLGKETDVRAMIIWPNGVRQAVPALNINQVNRIQYEYKGK